LTVLHVAALVWFGVISCNHQDADHAASDMAPDAQRDIYPTFPDGIWLPEFALPYDVRSSHDLCGKSDVGQKKHELIYGDIWPVHITVLDASSSMQWPIFGSKPALQVIVEPLVDFFKESYPARRGLVVFHVKVSMSVPPPATNSANSQSIIKALSKIKMEGGANFAAAFEQARKFLVSSTCANKTVALISDSEPTRAPGCQPQTSCVWVKALQEAALVRLKGGAAILPLVVLRSHYSYSSLSLMRQIAGEPNTGGGDNSLLSFTQTRSGVDRYIEKQARRICRVGPLFPVPFSAQKVSALLRLTGSPDVPLSRVTNIDMSPNSLAFEYRSTNSGAFIFLSRASCVALGKNMSKRVVVKWDS